MPTHCTSETVKNIRKNTTHSQTASYESQNQGKTAFPLMAADRAFRKADGAVGVKRKKRREYCCTVNVSVCDRLRRFPDGLRICDQPEEQLWNAVFPIL